VVIAGITPVQRMLIFGVAFHLVVGLLGWFVTPKVLSTEPPDQPILQVFFNV